MGWEMVAKEFDEVSKVGVAIFQKPANNSAYESREVAEPEICAEDNKADAAWLVLVFLYDDVCAIVRLLDVDQVNSNFKCTNDQKWLFPFFKLID